MLPKVLVSALLATAPPPRAPPPRATAVVATALSPALASLAELASAYDAFLLDQFGVIHDGKVAYDGAVEAVAAVQARGTKVCIISNSSRRKSDTIDRLRRMGFGPFDGDPSAGVPPISVVTSGDLVWEGLRRAADGACGEPCPGDELFSDLGGRKCVVFGNGEDDLEYTTTCGCDPSDVDEADFVMARGLFCVLGMGGSPSPYSAALESSVLVRALERGLPLLVANPDETRPDGKDSPMPGQLARHYSQMGATDVRLVGKPHPLIYTACRAQLGVGASVRLLGVGDSLHHDVLGAARAAVDSALVCSGVHHRELGVAQASAEEPAPEKLFKLVADFETEHGCAPTHVLRAFRL